jgi:hypothetical protein
MRERERERGRGLEEGRKCVCMPLDIVNRWLFSLKCGMSGGLPRSLSLDFCVLSFCTYLPCGSSFGWTDERLFQYEVCKHRHGFGCPNCEQEAVLGSRGSKYVDSMILSSTVKGLEKNLS